MIVSHCTWQVARRFQEIVVVLIVAMAAGGCSPLAGGDVDFGTYQSDSAIRQPLAGSETRTASASTTEAGYKVGSELQPAAAALSPTAFAQVESNGNHALTGPEFYTGSGVFAQQIAQVNPTAHVDTNGDVSLNFVNASVREVVDLVLGDILRSNYTIDPTVEGTVTVRTMRPLRRDAVLPTLEGILSGAGSALVRKGEAYHVVPLAKAAQGLSGASLWRDRGLAPSGYGIHILPLDYVSASSLEPVVKPLVGPGRQVRVDAARNLLVFFGPGPEADDLQDFVETFDLDWMDGMSFALFPLREADPKTIIGELNVVFGNVPEAAPLTVVELLPIERLNAVLAMTPQPKYLERVRVWIERLDRAGEGAERRIYVYYVENARAADLATSLNDIFDDDRRHSPFGKRLTPYMPFAPLAGDTLYESEGFDGGTLGQNEETLNADPESVPAIVTESPVGTRNIEAAAVLPRSEDIRVIADERNNALIILATPSEYRMIEATLRHLDIVPLQVLIEVTIAEVVLDNDLQYGLQWFFRSGNSSVTFSSLSSGAVASAFPGFSYVFSSVDAQVVLNALTSITDVNVISSPQLMVLDNEPAKLRVGDQVPIATQSAVSVIDPAAPIVNTIQFRDTGVILEVTPRVNSSGLVVIEVRQEVSDVVATTTSDIDSPTIQQRTIESTVAVNSGETIALGGLIRDRQEESVSGVPVISEIPILGNLFKTTSNSNLRTELLVLITPRVAVNRKDSQAITDELRQRMKGLEFLQEKIN